LESYLRNNVFFKLSLLIIIVLPLLLMSCTNISSKNSLLCKISKNENRKIKIIYIHGFGYRKDKKTKHKFSDNVRSFINSVNNYNLNKIVNFQTYTWNSDFNFEHIGNDWKNAVKKAEETESLLLNKELNKLETQNMPYYLVGHSLGASLIANCLNKWKKQHKNCHGIYFLGAAVSTNFRFKNYDLLSNIKIINYYSKKWDFTLKFLFPIAEGSDAIGRIGSEDEKFINYSCSTTHQFKKGPYHADWSQLAVPILYLILWKEDIPLSGGNGLWVKCRQKLDFFSFLTFQSTDTWNEVAKFSRNRKTIKIQHSKFDGHFRAVIVNPNNKLKRIAWGNNLHEILIEENLYDQRKAWPF